MNGTGTRPDPGIATLSDVLRALPSWSAQRMAFMVFAEDIDGGEPEDCWDCPVVRAVSRLLPGLIVCADDRRITVFETDAADETDEIGDVIGEAIVPPALARFIGQVDAGKMPPPQSFEIEIIRT